MWFRSVGQAFQPNGFCVDLVECATGKRGLPVSVPTFFSIVFAAATRANIRVAPRRRIASKVVAPFVPIRFLRLWVSGQTNSQEGRCSDSQLRGFLSRRARTLYFFAPTSAPPQL
jgi:hypothetical protein